jgi:hypothetical protein
VGQFDGTIINAMERLIPTVANHNGFQSRFVHHLVAWLKAAYQNIVQAKIFQKHSFHCLK